MLGVVQQVAKDIGDVEVGQLATFDQHVRRHPRLAEVRRPALDRRRRAQPRQRPCRSGCSRRCSWSSTSRASRPRRATSRCWSTTASVSTSRRCRKQVQGGADPAGDADLRPAQRQRLRVPDQRRAGHRGGDQERRHRRLRGLQRSTVQDPLRRRHQDQQDPLRQERPGLPVRLQARRPGPRPAARAGGPLHHAGVPVLARRDPACTARARTSCASSSSRTTGCSRTCAC